VSARSAAYSSGLSTGVSSQWMPALAGTEYSKSVERGLGILACFDQASRVLGVSELADRMGMSRSTTHRYVITLAKLGYLTQVAGRKYCLTLAVTRLGLSAMTGTSLREHASIDLQDLSLRTGFGVGAGVLDGPDVLLVEWMAGSRRGQRRAERGLVIGAMLPIYCTALGKILLANQNAKSRREILREMALTRRTPNTITTKRVLNEELTAIYKAGFGVEDEEYTPDAVSIAVTVRAGGGETVAALGMVAYSRTIALSDLVNALGPHLVAAADRISARLGFRRPDEICYGAGVLGGGARQ
jgi:IclR family pca regulon transcriptional regulator